MNQQTTTAALAATANRQPLKKRVFGEHPIGYAFVGPYFLFWLALFAFPLVFAVYISFHDYFAAPGAVVERPSWGSRTSPPCSPTRWRNEPRSMWSSSW